VLHTPLHTADETGLCDLNARGFSVTIHATMFLTVCVMRQPFHQAHSCGNF